MNNIFYPDNDKRVRRIHDLHARTVVELQQSHDNIQQIETVINKLGKDYTIPAQTAQFSQQIMNFWNIMHNLPSLQNQLGAVAETTTNIALGIIPIFGVISEAVIGDRQRDTYRAKIHELYILRAKAKLINEVFYQRRIQLTGTLHSLQNALQNQNNLIQSALIGKLSKADMYHYISAALVLPSNITVQWVIDKLKSEDKQSQSYTDDDPEVNSILQNELLSLKGVPKDNKFE